MTMRTGRRQRNGFSDVSGGGTAVESLCTGTFIMADRVSAGGVDMFGCMLNNRFSASQARITRHARDEGAIASEALTDNVIARQIGDR